jgi:hypothetical protein
MGVTCQPTASPAVLPGKALALGPYHGFRHQHIVSYLNEYVFRYNRRFCRVISFDKILGIAARSSPMVYWDIVGKVSHGLWRREPKAHLDPPPQRRFWCKRTTSGLSTYALQSKV